MKQSSKAMKARVRRSYPKIADEMPVIVATLYKHKKHLPQRMAFATPYQDEVENLLADMGIGCNEYHLWFGKLEIISEDAFRKL